MSLNPALAVHLIGIPIGFLLFLTLLPVHKWKLATISILFTLSPIAISLLMIAVSFSGQLLSL